MDAACRGAGHADRVGAQDAEDEGPGSEDVLAGPAAGAGRAAGGAGPAERPDRRWPAGFRRYGAEVAGAVRGAGTGGPGGPAQVRAAEADSGGGPGGGGGAGLPAARRYRGTAVAVDRAGTGRRARGAAPVQRAGVAVVGAADPRGEPGQAVAVPVVDLSPGPGLRGEGQRDPRPLPGPLPGGTARGRRPGPVVRCQALDPGPRPRPGDAARSAGPARPRGARVPAARRARPARRP
jgi:hypothetical protein